MNTLVTGAGGGIGAEVVRQLLAREGTVIAQDIDAARLEQHAHPRLVTTVGDLLAPEYRDELRALVDEAQIDSVIAAHGVDGSAALEDLSDAFVARVMAVNALSVTTLLQVTLPALRATQGTFEVIASQAGLVAESNNAAYCASKFAIVGWVRSIAPLLAAEQVHVRAFCPGCTETSLLFAGQERFAAAQGVPTEDFIQARKEGIPIKRFASVAETAATAVYLAEPGRARPLVLAATGGEVLH
jgi:NAD(P)-dependent dehydrogenase (short-subunit alcohol dehydrogenase family)